MKHNVLYHLSFLEMFKAWSFAMGVFSELIFGLGIFLGFDFCPHLITPVT